MAHQLSRISKRPRISRLFKNERGGAIIETVFVIPVFILVYVGMNYFADIITIRNKVVSASDAVASVVALDSSITNAEMKAIMSAGKAILEPLSGSIVITGVEPPPTGSGFIVKWRDADGGGSPPAVGSAYSFPAGVSSSFGQVRDKTVHVVTVNAGYTSEIGKILNNLPLVNLAIPTSSEFTQTTYSLAIGTDATRKWTKRVP